MTLTLSLDPDDADLLRTLAEERDLHYVDVVRAALRAYGTHAPS